VELVVPLGDGVEVGAVQLGRARLAALEQALATGEVPAAAAGPPVDPSTGRAALGGRARRAATDATAPTARPAEPPASTPEATSSPAVSAAGPDARDVRAEWDQVRATLKGIAKPLFAATEVERTTADTIVFVAPNAAHRDKCEQARQDVVAAWRTVTGQPVTVEVVTRDAPAATVPTAPPGPPDEDIDLDDLVDAPPGAVPTTIERLAEAFPGSELIERRD
jgi:DNA polymerase-3 subunit gamma/tau